ncbi:MAG: FecR domain-containing protein [Candidatus Omnitrophica bacterium]|nr:FecR domain-containing protein [Candidatus Omnitrophota bacterium]
MVRMNATRKTSPTIRCCIVSLCLSWCWQTGACCVDHAEVIDLSGKVQVLLEGTDEYADAREGMTLESGDKVRTSGAASAGLSFNEENTNLIRLGEKTDARISLAGDEKLELNDGEAFASVSDLGAGSSFEIRTPTAVAGSRGTDWVTTVTAEGTEVEAVDDEPYVRHYESSGQLANIETLIRPGEMTVVRLFERPKQFRRMIPERMQYWQSAKKDMRKRATQAFQSRSQRKPFDRNEFKRDLRQRRNQSTFNPLEDTGKAADDKLKPMGSREKTAAGEGFSATGRQEKGMEPLTSFEAGGRQQNASEEKSPAAKAETPKKAGKRKGDAGQVKDKGYGPF